MSENFDSDKTVIKGGSGSARVSEAATPVVEQADVFALPVGTRISDFEITKLIGVGGFGIVYLARDHSLDRYVALKEYMPASVASRGKEFSVSVRSERHADVFAAGLRSFINEAHLLAHFDHPSLVKVHRFWETGSTAFMVMPYYEGPTLKQALREMDSPPSEAWLKSLLSPLLDALQLLHRENCFHRDISPDNIILMKSGQPVLLDFGAARRVIGGMTKNLTVIVKSGYAPIEQYSDDLDTPQGAWTDIYAVGALAYFAIMGKAPSPSISRVIKDPVVPLEEAAAGRYKPGFLLAIDRALQVNPKHRPQSAQELLQLLGWSDGPLSPAQPVGQAKIGTSENPARRLPMKAIAGAIALVAVVVVAAAMWLLPQKQRGPATVLSQRSQSATVPVPMAGPSVMPELIAPSVITEMKDAEPAQIALPPAQITDGASSSPVSFDTTTRGAQAGASSPPGSPVGSSGDASGKPPAATAIGKVAQSAPAKRSTAPAPVKRPPAPVEPPPAPVVRAPAKTPPAPVESPPVVLPAPQSEPANAPGVVGISPKNACKKAVLNWICMKEMCGQAEFRSNKDCVEWRAK